MDITKPIHVIVESIAKSDGSIVVTLSAYLTPVIAVLAFIIAYQQYRINKQRFLFETYKDRVKVYDAVQDYIKGIRDKETTSIAKIRDLQKETSQAIFLFDKSIKKR